MVPLTVPPKSYQMVSSIATLVHSAPVSGLPDMLFVGAVPGVYFSRDRGRNWMRIKANMPNVPAANRFFPRDTSSLYCRADFWRTRDGGF